MNPVNSYYLVQVRSILIFQSQTELVKVKLDFSRVILPKLHYLEKVNTGKKVKTVLIDSKNVKIIECQHYGHVYGHVYDILVDCAVCI